MYFVTGDAAAPVAARFMVYNYSDRTQCESIVYGVRVQCSSAHAPKILMTKSLAKEFSNSL